MNLTDYAVRCVDDDPAVLVGCPHTLGRTSTVHPADSGTAGLVKLRTEGPLAVVVSDMDMPVMNGVGFLSQVQHVLPDTVRIMLTGYGNHETASASINEGRIFRFLVKP